MFFSLIRRCYRSSSAEGDDGSSSSSSSTTYTVIIDAHARMTRTISRRVNRQAPVCSERRRIERWRPSLSAISEDASTTVHAGETDRSFGKFLVGETAPFSRRDHTTLKGAWRNTITYRIASPGFAPSPFMY